MRVRRKKRLEERLSEISSITVFMERENKDFSVKDESTILDFEEIFGNSNPVALEIGCGKGQFICTLAAKNPDMNFLAVEKESNIIVSAAERAISENIKNVRFLRGAAEYLESYVPCESIERIYLNFSCPFPKKKYSAHRLTHRRFLEIYEKLLKSGGEIHQKTDNMKLFEFSIEEFSCSGWSLKNISLDLHSSGFEENIVTEYEQKFADMGQPIYRLEAFLRE